MMATTGLCSSGGSWLHRLDPRVKLLFALLSIAACLIVPRLEVIASVLILTQVVLLSGGLSVRRVGQLWLGLAPLIGIILVFQPLLSPGSGPVLWQVGPVHVTLSGIMAGGRYSLQVAAAAFAASVPIMTTPIPLLVRGLEKTGLPYRWGMMIGLALHYLVTLHDLYNTISEAQQARGWDLSRRGLVKRVKALVPTLVALIVASLRLGDSLALGLASRGFGASAETSHRRTVLNDVSFRPVDWMALATLVAAFVALALVLYA